MPLPNSVGQQNIDTPFLPHSPPNEPEMWDNEKDVWVRDDGTHIIAAPNIFWYAAPAAIESTGPNMQPLAWGVVLHNARLASGRHIPARLMYESMGITPTTMKRGQSKEAEDALEAARKRVNPAAPSRLACFFVSLDEETAIYRLNNDLRGDRKIVQCRILGDGPVHIANIKIYEQLCDRPRDLELAESYWKRYQFSRNEDPKRLEFLVGGSLYFPDWATFPLINLAEIGEWQTGKVGATNNIP